MATLNISLPEPLKEYVKSEVENGEYSNSSDYIRHLIREKRKSNFLEKKSKALANPLSIKRNPFIPASKIILEEIPKTPPECSTNSIIKNYSESEGGDGWIIMTRNNAIADGSMWIAREEFDSHWDHGSLETTKIHEWFISPEYGREYHARVYDGNNELIHEFGDQCWEFRYDTGVLIFEEGRKESGLNEDDTIKIKAYRYVGKTLADLKLCNT